MTATDGRSRFPRIDYITDPEPLATAAALRFMVVIRIGTYLAFLPALIPTDAPRRPTLLVAALLMLAVDAVLMVVQASRARASAGWQVTPPMTALLHTCLLTVAIGVFDAGTGGGQAWFRPAMILPTLLLCIVGNVAMAGMGWTVAVAAFAGSASIRGVPVGELAGATWTVVITWATLVAAVCTVMHGSLLTMGNSRNVTVAAATAARCSSLEQGLTEMSGLVTATCFGSRWASTVVPHRQRSDGPVEQLDIDTGRWSPAAESPDPVLVAEALAHDGHASHRDRALIVAEDGAGTTVILELHIDVPPEPELSSLRYDLERFALQLAVMTRRLYTVAELDRLVATDALTGLANRRGLMTRLAGADEDRRHNGRPLTLVMIDVDDFKSYNDTFGHPEGDRLLVGLGALLAGTARQTDVVARYGGEEFCMVLPGSTAAGAVDILARLHDGMAGLAARRHSTFSAGVAEQHPGEGLDSLLRRADHALYEAKAAGKACTVVDDNAIVATSY